jgi:hypothetical protein
MTKFASLPELIWSALVVLTTGAVTIWSAYLLGLHITGPGSSLALGLGLNGLAVLVFGLTLTVGVVTAPAAVRRLWAAKEPLAASLIGLAWIIFCALGAVLVIRADPLGLPGWPTDSGAVGMMHVIVAIAVFSLFLILSAIPAALVPLDGSRPLFRDGPSVRRAPRPTGTISGLEHLWIILEELFQRSPGPVDDKTTILENGTIVTSQRALADMLSTSSGPINRYLRVLRASGRIHLETNKRGTRITRIASVCRESATLAAPDC